MCIRLIQSFNSPELNRSMNLRAPLKPSHPSGPSSPKDSLKLSQKLGKLPFGNLFTNPPNLLNIGSQIVLNPRYRVEEILKQPSEEKLPIFDILPGLAQQVPHVDLGVLPTPVEAATQLEKAIDSKANLFIKRDDLSSGIYGGNKVRKLEFTLGDVLKQGSQRMITGGGLGSHMANSVAAFGQAYGIKTDVILFKQPLNEHVKQNMLLNHHFGATMEYSSNYAAFAVDIAKQYAVETVKDMQKPYLILPGDSNPLSNLGYVNAAFEIKQQVMRGEIPEPDYIFVAAGSCGTMAGLLVGLRLAGMKTKLVGVQVSDGMITNERTVAHLASKTFDFIRENSSAPIPDINISPDDISMKHDYIGSGYGQPSQKAEVAIDLLKEHQGVKLDPTYTGKAMAAMIDFAKSPANKGKNVMFINTLNSRDLSQQAASVNYKDLPKDFHQFYQ